MTIESDCWTWLGAEGNPPRLAGELPLTEAGFATSVPECLSDAFVAETCLWINTPAELADAARRCAALMRESPAALRLAHHIRKRFEDPGLGYPEVAAWPVPSQPEKALFLLVSLLGCIPGMRNRNGARGIPEDVTRDTLGDMVVWADDFRQKKGFWGFANAGWLWHHLSGILVRLGRLQFCLERTYYPYRAFRHITHGNVVFFADDGLSFRPDGQSADADGGLHPDAWKSVFICDATTITGNRVTPNGVAERSLIELPASEWTPIFAKGDAVFGIHIPAIGPMTPEACADSMRRAADFFPRYRPDHGARAFTCASWLLDHQFDTLLPERSNIRAFARGFHLLPLQGANDAQTIERVFGSGPVPDPAKPGLSSLQRTVAEHYRAGGRCRGGGGVIFVDDLRDGVADYRS